MSKLIALVISKKAYRIFDDGVSIFSSPYSSSGFDYMQGAEFITSDALSGKEITLINEILFLNRWHADVTSLSGDNSGLLDYISRSLRSNMRKLAKFGYSVEIN